MVGVTRWGGCPGLEYRILWYVYSFDNKRLWSQGPWEKEEEGKEEKSPNPAQAQLIYPSLRNQQGSWPTVSLRMTVGQLYAKVQRCEIHPTYPASAISHYPRLCIALHLIMILSGT